MKCILPDTAINFRERGEDEIPLVHMWMWDDEVRRVNHPIAIEKNVEIKSTREFGTLRTRPKDRSI